MNLTTKLSIHLPTVGPTMPLGTKAKGFKGKIQRVDATDCSKSLPSAELERRLMEMGFVEGSTVEIKHEGLLGRDPIAVRVNNTTVALRRQAANALHVVALPSDADEPSS